MERPGYYVEGKFFAGKSAQAIAFAQFRADEFGRNVAVQVRDFDGSIREIGHAAPGERQLAVAEDNNGAGDDGELDEAA